MYVDVAPSEARKKGSIGHDEGAYGRDVRGEYKRQAERRMGADPGYDRALREQAVQQMGRRLDYGTSPYKVDPRDQKVFGARGNIAATDFRSGVEGQGVAGQESAADMVLRRQAAIEMIRRRMFEADLAERDEDKAAAAAQRQTAMQLVQLAAQVGGTAMGGPAVGSGASAAVGAVGAAGGGQQAYGGNTMMRPRPPQPYDYY